MTIRFLHLEDKGGTLGLLVTAKLEVLAALEGELGLGLALRALEAQHDLLGRLGLLVEDGLRLASVSGLLAVVPALALGEERGLVGGCQCSWEGRNRGRGLPCRPCIA